MVTVIVIHRQVATVIVVIKEHAVTRLSQVVNVCLLSQRIQHHGVSRQLLLIWQRVLLFLRFIDNGFNNTFYGQEHDVANVSCGTGKKLKVVACFYGINSANPGCQPPTASANCSSMDVTSKCASQCNSSSCNFAVENSNFGDTCVGQVKTFWMYFTCS